MFLPHVLDLTTSLAFIRIQVCREWESTALKVDDKVRLVRIRIGVALGRDGGTLGLNLSSESILH